MFVFEMMQFEREFGEETAEASFVKDIRLRSLKIRR